MALKTVREVRNPWVKSRGQLTATQVAYRQSSLGDTARNTPWGVTSAAAHETVAWWRKVTAADNNDVVPWGKFGARLNGDKVANWLPALPADDGSYSPWGKYGEMLNEDRFGIWRGSKPADDFTLGIFEQHSIPLWRELPGSDRTSSQLYCGWWITHGDYVGGFCS